MELNKCPKCKGQAKVYEFVVQCEDCRTGTRCFANQQAAINAWQIGVDLIRRYPVTGRYIKAGSEIYAK